MFIHSLKECRGKNNRESKSKFECPNTTAAKENADHVHYMLMVDRGLTINQITSAISISCRGVENILCIELGIELGMMKVLLGKSELGMMKVLFGRSETWSKVQQADPITQKPGIVSGRSRWLS